MRDGRTRKICVTAKILAELIVSANAYGKFDQKNVLRVIYGMMSDYNTIIAKVSPLLRSTLINRAVAYIKTTLL